MSNNIFDFVKPILVTLLSLISFEMLEKFAQLNELIKFVSQITILILTSWYLIKKIRKLNK